MFKHECNKLVIMPNQYVLTENLKKRLENRGKIFLCDACGKPLELGQPIISKVRGRPSRRTVYYHVSCWKKLWR